MNATDPTYFLYSGRLFHETALPALLAQLDRSEAGPPSSQPRPEDPGPEGPEGEPVGEDEAEGEGNDDSDAVPTARETVEERKPLPGAGMPVVPEHGAPDANPIDPRVF